MKVIIKPILLLFLVLNLTQCQNTSKNESAHVECADVHWSDHQGEEGPENWKTMCVSFADCGGSAQSPIDINTNSVIASNNLVKPLFSYKSTKTDIINNGHTVQFNVDKGNFVHLNNKKYELLQFHYHAVSEHTIDGQAYPLEVHFVHKHSETDYAVLGVMIHEGEENPFLGKYLTKIPVAKNTYSAKDEIALNNLLPENKSYYHYKGSLTTPPCSEVVSWFVLKHPVEFSALQMKVFSLILDENFRPVMPLNNREVLVFNE